VPPIISVVGKSRSGKTTLIEKLIPELKRRGYRIGTVKHAFHKFEMDKKGKDSWRHKAAGAATVIVVAQDTLAMVKDESLNSLNDLEKYFDDMDLVITEGFKQKNKPKIEVCRAARNTEPLCRDNRDLIALVTDLKINLNVPAFGLEDIKGLADLIEKTFL